MNHANLNGIFFLSSRCVSRRRRERTLKLNRRSSAVENRLAQQRYAFLPPAAAAPRIYAYTRATRAHSRTRTRALTVARARTAQVYTRGGAHAPIICTANIQYYTIHIRRPPVGAETQEGRAFLSLSASAWPMRLYPKCFSIPFPPSNFVSSLQGDAERRNARETLRPPSSTIFICINSTHRLKSPHPTGELYSLFTVTINSILICVSVSNCFTDKYVVINIFLLARVYKAIF